MDDFYLVSMLTKNNKKLYLKEKVNSDNSFEWTFDYNEAIWFPAPSECEKFAKEYFKNFNGYVIETIHYSI